MKPTASRFLRFCTLITVQFFTTVSLQAQSLHFGPGFSAAESHVCLDLSKAFLDTNVIDGRITNQVPGHQFVRRSKVVGLANGYDLWIRQDSTIVISLRGTTGDAPSILVDFYGAMMPAKGKIQLYKDETFDYKLAEHPRAGIFGGWLVAFAYLAHDIRPSLDSLFALGYKNILVTGHSQGGALCYPFSAWLQYLKKDGVYPQIRVKTMASAAPKIGNMYFAYDYDYVNGDQWAYCLVNAADIVPEYPYTTQQVDLDMNSPNPYQKLEERVKKLSLLKRWYIGGALKKMRKSARKSSRAYQKYLGNMAGKMVHQMLPELKMPAPMNSTYFVRPAVQIVIVPDTAYYAYFEPKNWGPYYHHALDAYQYLLTHQYEK